VAGKLRWKSRKRNETMMNLATPTDEALALLILENALEKWTNMAKLAAGTKTTVKTKYTRANAKGGSTKYGGWTTAGKKRFNQLVEMVKQDRRNFGGWDEDYMEKQNTAEGQGKPSKRQKTAPEEVVEMVMDDMFFGPTAIAI
jgi:hypothetical protein